MSDFPTLSPSSRVYIPGGFANSSLPNMGGTETNVRHSSCSFGHRLNLTFKSVSRSDHFSLISHYALHGTFEAFDLTSTTLVATNLTFPSNYQWRYLASPEITEAEGQIDIGVSLELLPPYTI